MCYKLKTMLYGSVGVRSTFNTCIISSLTFIILLEDRVKGFALHGLTFCLFDLGFLCK